MTTMQQLLEQASALGASDLHLSSGEPPALRVHGDLARLESPPLAAHQVLELVHSIMSDAQRERFAVERDADFACELPGAGRYRVNVFVQSRGPGAVLRPNPTSIPSEQDIALPAALKENCEKERGLVLVTGPNVSGKSTTLAAMVNHINQTWDAHILTVEDPIEFVHTARRCFVNHREVGP